MVVLFISLSDVPCTFIMAILRFLPGLFCLHNFRIISCFKATIGPGNFGVGSSSGNSLLWSHVRPASRSSNTA